MSQTNSPAKTNTLPDRSASGWIGLSARACRRGKYVNGQSSKRRKQKQHGDGGEEKERSLF